MIEAEAVAPSMDKNQYFCSQLYKAVGNNGSLSMFAISFDVVTHPLP